MTKVLEYSSNTFPHHNPRRCRMEDKDTSGNLEMRITELENQLKELREAQQSMSGQAGGAQQAAIPCGYCGYCYCGYCYCSYCYASGGQTQATIPCSTGPQATAACA